MSNHHIKDAICLLCQDKIKTTHPQLQEVWEKIKRQFPDCHISWGFRSQEYQDLFYHEGKTKCRWPNSMHNKMKNNQPYSRAIDLFRLNTDGVAEFRRPYYAQISLFLINQGCPIQWSGNWIKFIETDHFQLLPEIV